MSGQKESPLCNVTGVDLKGLSKPLEKLISCVSKGIGELYEPMGIVRRAKAQAKAEIILAHADGDKKEIALRAAHRLAFLETRRQTNIEFITSNAAKLLPDSVDEKPVSEDWTVHFFQQAQDVGESEMQQLWAKILAGEVAKPGSFSRRTLDRVRTLDRDEAELFSKACRTLWIFDDTNYQFQINSETADKFEKDLGIRAYENNHLKNIGLIGANDLWYNADEMKEFSATYFSTKFTLAWPNGSPPKREKLHMPKMFSITPLTDVGMELAKIVTCEPILEFGKTLMENLAKDVEMVLNISSKNGVIKVP